VLKNNKGVEMFMEVIILLVMVLIFVIGAFFPKLPVAFSLIIAAIVGALLGGFGFPFRHLVEGTQLFLYLMLIVAAGMIFMGVIKASGELDDLTRLIIEKFYRMPSLVLILLMFLIMLPAMLTGSAPASVLSTGVLVIPILTRLGLPKEEIAAIISMGSIFGLVAPPINVPAMIIATGVYMPYEGFTIILLILTIPLAIFSVLFLGRKYIKNVQPEEILKDLSPSTKKFWIHLPLILVLCLMIVIRSFPGKITDIGTPMVFIVGSFLGLFTGKRFNVLQVCKKSMSDSVGILSIFVAVGTLIQIMSLTGVRGLLVLASLSLGGVFLYLAIAISAPLLGGPLIPFGVAGVLGVPLVLTFIGKNSIIVTSAITLIISLGCLTPPTAISGIFAAQVVGVDKYSKVLKKCLIPSLLTLIVGILTLVFVDQIDKILF
jgi:TRAP-type C4-dicarboxylate transport system permease large subunit